VLVTLAMKAASAAFGVGAGVDEAIGIVIEGVGDAAFAPAAPARTAMPATSKRGTTASVRANMFFFSELILTRSLVGPAGIIHMMDPFPPTAQQQAVISHRSANLLVFAGPGTGKTETLARRFAALVAEGMPAGRILVLTFSRRAADEMRDRIVLRMRQKSRSGLAVSELFVRTFHSFCGRLLDGNDARGRRRELLSPVKERLLWRSVVQDASLVLSSFDANVKDSTRFAADCLNVIAHLKGQGVAVSQLEHIAHGDERLSDICRIFSAMERAREAGGLSDYRDLVNDAVTALARPESAASLWLRRAAFAHILVDEFQDSDPMQLRLLERIRDVSSPKPVFCFVGDVNQSIYRFRGATPENVERARISFACQTLPLHDNRRSAQAILEVANADSMLQKDSLTAAADPTKLGNVRLLRPRTADDEVRAIRDAVAEKIAAGTSPRAIAVLLRATHPYQELITDALSDVGIPVAAQPTAGFHEDALVDCVLTALRLLAAPDDEPLWRRLLQNPIVGFRPIDVRATFDVGRRKHMTDPQAMLRSYEPDGVRPVREFLAAWSRCRQAAAKAAPVELVQTVVYELDLLRAVRESDGIHGVDPVASPLRLDALLAAAEDHGFIHDPASRVKSFIDHLDETVELLVDATQPPPSATDGVRVMSIHAAKGLEFDFIVIPQLLDERLPAAPRDNGLLSERTRRALDQNGISVLLSDTEARQEEHSLWYVALTRAREGVLATAALVDDDGVERTLSPFADAISITTRASVEPSPAAPPTSAASIGDGAPQPEARSRADLPELPIRLQLDTLSPTGINNFLSCPRRFYYQKVVGLDASDEESTRLGNLLHQVLRRFHEVEQDFTRVRDADAAVQRYQPLLRKLVAEETASANLESSSPLARYEREDLERKLDGYAQHLVEQSKKEPFAVVACELPTDTAIEGGHLAGKVDRVDRLARGGLRIIDYKSGRKKRPLASGLRGTFERLGSPIDIFSGAFENISLQTVLYLRGVERHFHERVVLLEYIYFRGDEVGDTKLTVDATRIADGNADGDGVLASADVDRVERDIVTRIFDVCSSGELRRFPTAHDENTCRNCAFTAICPGPGVRS
jgi:superfamily I DNA/RNA helicase/CRISPR/Cas system-associated exonuclease Cas4 (RecB family)